MSQASHTKREFRVIAAGLFKATCLQLLDDVSANTNLSIIVTKRGKPVGSLTAPPQGLTLIGPTIQATTASGHILPTLKADASPAPEEQRKKKKKKRKKK